MRQVTLLLFRFLSQNVTLERVFAFQFTCSGKRKALFCTSIGSPGAYILVLFALTLAPLSYVAPGREIGMMVGVVVGALLLKESLTPKRISGAALMVLGVVLIGLAK